VCACLGGGWWWWWQASYFHAAIQTRYFHSVRQYDHSPYSDKIIDAAKTRICLNVGMSQTENVHEKMN